MNYEKYKSQINDYLNGDLDKEEQYNFINYLNSDSDFKKLVDDIIFNDNLLRSAPYIETKANFIVNLNTRIDYYNNKSSLPFLKRLFNINTSKISMNQFAGFMSLALIISFTIFKVSNSSSINNYHLSNIDENVDISVAVNDSDSLYNINSELPILLLGNDK
mgnify:CR=1 FL=1|tara:strand:+ start:243 stop:728 length:486 start_codon:yes stop_codon:yes gene_type:complete